MPERASPPSRLVAGVFSSSSLMQNTRPWRTAGNSVQPRCSTIFSSGTRSPAPHQAATIASGCAAATSSAVVVLPGSPTNSPPAASTSSATHGCDAMIGLPHSSQKTLGLDAAAVRVREPPRSHVAWLAITLCPCPMRPLLLRSQLCRCRCRRAFAEPAREIARQLSGSRPPPPLIGNRRQHQVGTRGENLFRSARSTNRRRSGASRRQPRGKRRRNILCKPPAGRASPDRAA